MSYMIFVPSFHENDNLIEGNEEFKLGGKDFEKINNFFEIFKLLNSRKLLFSKFFTTLLTLEVLKF